MWEVRGLQPAGQRFCREHLCTATRRVSFILPLLCLPFNTFPRLLPSSLLACAPFSHSEPSSPPRPAGSDVAAFPEARGAGHGGLPRRVKAPVLPSRNSIKSSRRPNRSSAFSWLLMFSCILSPQIYLQIFVGCCSLFTGTTRSFLPALLLRGGGSSLPSLPSFLAPLSLCDG